MIKLIATDLDGTLFYPKRVITGIPYQNKKLLKKFMASGGELLLASGRSTRIKKKVEKALHHQITLVGCNGAYVVDENNKISDRTPLDRKKLLELYVRLRHAYGALSWMLFDDQDPIYVSYSDISRFLIFMIGVVNKTNGFYSENLIHEGNSFLNKLSNTNNYKLLIAFGIGESAKKKASEIYLTVKEQFGNYFTVALSDNALEITAPGVDKGSGLKKYCQDKGYDINEVIVCGDSGNDYSLFRDFPHSFCMSHSPDWLKKQANHVIDRIADLDKYIADQSLLSTDKLKTTN
ncbi:MAG: Cof-type HAD-IIB family hydrolase [Bacilli bacterium]|jgi:Cof subfamily protein (haloacid dehalogenase superfamily)